MIEGRTKVPPWSLLRFKDLQLCQPYPEKWLSKLIFTGTRKWHLVEISKIPAPEKGVRWVGFSHNLDFCCEFPVFGKAHLICSWLHLPSFLCVCVCVCVCVWVRERERERERIILSWQAGAVSSLQCWWGRKAFKGSVRASNMSPLMTMSLRNRNNVHNNCNSLHTSYSGAKVLWSSQINVCGSNLAAFGEWWPQSSYGHGKKLPNYHLIKAWKAFKEAICCTLWRRSGNQLHTQPKGCLEATLYHQGHKPQVLFPRRWLFFWRSLQMEQAIF